jgi:hypothetical protein
MKLAPMLQTGFKVLAGYSNKKRSSTPRKNIQKKYPIKNVGGAYKCNTKGKSKSNCVGHSKT